MCVCVSRGLIYIYMYVSICFEGIDIYMCESICFEGIDICVYMFLGD